MSITMTFCNNCEHPLPYSAATCTHCGAWQRRTIRTAYPPCLSGKSKFIAAALALVLGGLGAHKFYLGAWGWGLVYLALCMTWVPTVVSLVEAVRYLTLPEATFQRKTVGQKSAFSFIW